MKIKNDLTHDRIFSSRNLSSNLNLLKRSFKKDYDMWDSSEIYPTGTAKQIIQNKKNKIKYENSLQHCQCCGRRLHLTDTTLLCPKCEEDNNNILTGLYPYDKYLKERKKLYKIFNINVRNFPTSINKRKE